VTVWWIVRTRGFVGSPPAAEDVPSSPRESAAEAAIKTATRPPAMIRAKRFFLVKHGRRGR
jgi:hypothetical protein